MSDYTPPKFCPWCDEPTSLCRCEINQCDGCRRGLTTRQSQYGTTMHDGEDGMPVMICTADLYRCHR